MKGWRPNLIIIIIFLFGATIIGRLVFLQIINHGYWKALAAGQQKIFEQVRAKRGEISIKDKLGNSYILATDTDSQFVFLYPNEISDKDGTADKLSKILNLEKEFVLEKMKNEESSYVILKSKLIEDDVKVIKELNLEGVYLQTENLRYYPLGSFASHILGFVGGDGTGQYGLEGYYNDILSGKTGFIEGEKSRSGYSLFFDTNFSPAESGTNLLLTLDYNIQFKAEQLLKKAKEDLKIESGTIIVANPINGEIIALADHPSFDPNNYGAVKDLDIFQNSALQKLYEPGSIFKPITMSAAIDQGKITPQTSYTDPGVLKIGGYTINNFANKSYGQQTMTQVLERSINTGAVFAEKAVGDATFVNYVKNFGFFDKTGIDLQGEVYSNNKSLKSGREINYVTASFGQGIEVTPIQLIRAFSAIANGGKLVTPHIVKDPQQKLDNGREVISSGTASQVQAMIVSVIENGYSKNIRVPGYYLAGKTGTAQIPFAAMGIDKAGYSDKTTQSFIGFGPAYNAKFLILVKLDNPKANTAEYSAAPIFKELAKYIIDYWQIPPDYDINENTTVNK